MSSTSGRTPLLPVRVTPAPVTWRSWPLAEGGYTSWLMLGTLLLIGGVVGFATRSGVWAAVAVLVTAIAAWRFFVPVIYELSPLGITQHILFWRRRISWRSVERTRLGREGVFLSPPAAPLTPFRGL